MTLTSNPNTTLVNELRASTNRTNLFFGCTGFGLFDSFGYTDQVGRALTSPAGSLGFGCQGWVMPMTRAARLALTQYWDTLTKVVGAHTMKFGAEFRNVYSNNLRIFALAGPSPSTPSWAATYGFPLLQG